MTEIQKRQIFDNVDANIIMCGDIGYQLPPIIVDYKELRMIHGLDGVTEMNTEGFGKIHYFKKNMSFLRVIYI